MRNADGQPDDELFETFLDGLSIEDDRESLLAALRTDPTRQRQEKLQSQIDDGLRRLFVVEAPARDAIVAALTKSSVSAERPAERPRNVRRFGIAAALAASLLAAVA